MKKKRGKLFILVGPSGVGKTSLINNLLKNPKNREVAEFVPTYTTRSPRPYEQDKIDFNFLTVEQFDNKIKDDFFLEWSQEYKYYYGSPKKRIFDLIDSGKSVIITTDRWGAEQIIKKIDKVIIIYLLPPDMKILKERLLSRKTESGEKIKIRIKQSVKDLASEKENPISKYKIINKNLEIATNEFEKIIKKNIG